VPETGPRLVGIAGPFKGTTFPLSEGEFSIGRESSNQLWVSDPALSRRHCIVSSEGAEFIVRDLKSRHGTSVNGVTVEAQQLSHGDQISVGDSTLVFLVDDRAPRLESGPLKFTDAELVRPVVLLRPEDAVYLQPAQKTAALNERTAKDLNSIFQIALGIGAIRDWESLQWQLLGSIFDVVPADRGAVLLLHDLDKVDSVAAWDRLRGPGYAVRISRTVLRRVLQNAAGLLVSDLPADETLHRVSSIDELDISSLLCVPLTHAGGVLGAIYLDSQREHFDEHHLQVMTAVAAIASLALDNVRHWERLRRENQDLRIQIGLDHNMVGHSRPMREVLEFVRRVAPTDSTVLVQGESGTGKELVARALHQNSPRSDQPFVAINCATLTETLLESELFGHEKGAFTGAVVQKKGKLEVAHGGTLFLDEVSEMVPLLQAKLLRVLQEREFERVGGTKPIKVDIRLIAATNKSLPDAVSAGTFRGDLFYRLNVVTIAVPPLRQRQDDIPALAQYFLAKAATKCKVRARPLSPQACACLMSYDWPGNIRELENAMERAVVLGSGEAIDPEDLPESVLEATSNGPASTAHYHGAIKDLKKQLITRALQTGNGNYIEAAKALGMHPNSLLRLIRNLGLKATGKTE
jgi:transcriptional regulator with GAF, ATPase, and Fis domain